MDEKLITRPRRPRGDPDRHAGTVQRHQCRLAGVGQQMTLPRSSTAGSLRMATYRLNWKLESGASAQEIASLQADMLKRLNSSDLHVILNGKPDEPLQQAYNQLLGTWQVQLQPALERGDKVFFQQQAESFVSQLEHFVTLLQHQSERRQGLAAEHPGRSAAAHGIHPDGQHVPAAERCDHPAAGSGQRYRTLSCR